jgi:hypothetical protein
MVRHEVNELNEATGRTELLAAPPFHDGPQATLWDVIDHYNKGRYPAFGLERTGDNMRSTR